MSSYSSRTFPASSARLSHSSLTPASSPSRALSRSASVWPFPVVVSSSATSLTTAASVLQQFSVLYSWALNTLPLTPASSPSRALSRSAAAAISCRSVSSSVALADSCCVSSSTVFCASPISRAFASRSPLTPASSSRALSRSAAAAFSCRSVSSSAHSLIAVASVLQRFCASPISWALISRSPLTPASSPSRALSRSAAAAFSCRSVSSSAAFADSCCVSFSTVFCVSLISWTRVPRSLLTPVSSASRALTCSARAVLSFCL